MTLSAQTSDDEWIMKAHLAWNKYANLANAWASQHSDYIISKKDKELFHQTLAAEREMEKAFRQIGYK